MSFHHELVGLVKSRPQSSLPSQFVPIDDLDLVTMYSCPDWAGNPYPCEGAGDSVHGFSIDLPGTGYDPAADYFNVSVHITGPVTIAPGGCHGMAAPTDTPPCGAVGGDFPVYDGVVSPGGWTRQIVVSGATDQEAVPDTFTAIGTAGSNWRAFTYWPDRTTVPGTARGERAYLVNPAPVWPVPDVAGNEFGNCLFTAGQLPGSIDLVLTHHNRDMEHPGRLWAHVQAYVLGDPVAPEGVHGIYIHGA